MVQEFEVGKIKTHDKLKHMFDRDVRYAKWGGDVKIIEHSFSAEKGERVKIELYTETNCYSITAITGPNRRTYLGCGASTRKPRSGEDWTRRNDLPDGPFNEKTWRNILGAIVGYELVKIQNQENKG
jgi:hypothetical protein